MSIPFHWSFHYKCLTGYPLASVGQRIQWHSSKEFQQTAAVARDLGSVDQITRSTSWCQHVSWMKSQGAGKSADVARVTVLWFTLIDLLALGILASICFPLQQDLGVLQKDMLRAQESWLVVVVVVVVVVLVVATLVPTLGHLWLVPDSASMYCLHRPSPISANLVR